MQDFEERVVIEEEELLKKIVKLKLFIMSDAFSLIKTFYRWVLIRQYIYYCGILSHYTSDKN